MIKEDIKKVEHILNDVMNNRERKIVGEEYEKDGVRIEYLEVEVNAINCLMITGCCHFLIGIVKRNKKYKYTVENIGILLEEIVLKLTEIGISSCFVAGFANFQVIPYFKKRNIPFSKKEDNIAVMCPIGYKSKYQPICVSFLEKYVSKSTTRYPNKKFFRDGKFKKGLDIKKLEEKYQQVFECCRFSPNASNMQMGFRQIKIGKNYHFYRNLFSKFYSRMDMGIALCNWRTACEYYKIKGNFIFKEPDLSVPAILTYFITWVEE